MIHNDIQNQLQLLIKVSAPPLIEVAEHPAQAPEWAVGQRLPAHVQAALPNGRFQVMIENQVLDMNLPRNTQAGDTLELTYVGNFPRLTFALSAQQAAAANPQAAVAESPEVAAGRIVEQIRVAVGFLNEAAKLGRWQVTELVRNALATLSEAAKQGGGRQAELLRDAMLVLGEALELGGGRAGVPIRSAQAALTEAAKLSLGLLASLPEDAPVSLSDAGKYVSGLQQNPQAAAQAGEAGNSRQAFTAPLSGRGEAQLPAAALNKSQPVLDAPPGPGKPLAEALNTTIERSGLFYESHQLQWISGDRPLAALRQEPQGALPPLQGANAGTPADGAQRTDAAGQSPIHQRALPLVQQQLETLENRVIAWQGQIWPGQDMRWEIEEDARRQQGGDELPPAWKTRLHLELPRLGGVTAEIALQADGVRIGLAAARGDSAEVLKREQGGLAQSFGAAGLSLAAVTVQHG